MGFNIFVLSINCNCMLAMHCMGHGERLYFKVVSPKVFCEYFSQCRYIFLKQTTNSFQRLICNFISKSEMLFVLLFKKSWNEIPTYSSNLLTLALLQQMPIIKVCSVWNLMQVSSQTEGKRDRIVWERSLSVYNDQH